MKSLNLKCCLKDGVICPWGIFEDAVSIFESEMDADTKALEIASLIEELIGDSIDDCLVEDVYSDYLQIVSFLGEIKIQTINSPKVDTTKDHSNHRPLSVSLYEKDVKICSVFHMDYFTLRQKDMREVIKLINRMLALEAEELKDNPPVEKRVRRDGKVEYRRRVFADDF